MSALMLEHEVLCYINNIIKFHSLFLFVLEPFYQSKQIYIILCAGRTYNEIIFILY